DFQVGSSPASRSPASIPDLLSDVRSTHTLTPASFLIHVAGITFGRKPAPHPAAKRPNAIERRRKPSPSRRRATIRPGSRHGVRRPKPPRNPTTTQQGVSDLTQPRV